jgi:DNA-binding response OmpR family regulator
MAGLLLHYARKVKNHDGPKELVPMSNRRILLVEDEKDIADLVALHLGDLCKEFVVAEDGHEGMRLATSGSWALTILDLRLPGPDGLEICRAIRRERPYQPILMLTSKSAELDRVLGLETGADDYLTKPFSVLELVARVRAIFRRIENMQQVPAMQEYSADKIGAGNLTIDPDRREVTLGDRQIDLTAREFDLLDYFVRNPGRVFRRAELLDQVCDPSRPEMIVTVWGVGYKFACQNPVDTAV